MSPAVIYVISLEDFVSRGVFPLDHSRRIFNQAGIRRDAVEEMFERPPSKKNEGKIVDTSSARVGGTLILVLEGMATN